MMEAMSEQLASPSARAATPSEAASTWSNGYAGQQVQRREGVSDIEIEDQPDELEVPIIGPSSEPEVGGEIEVPRLARHYVTLSDGHRVGLSVSGRGVPLVVVHGFSAEGFLYAQTLNRLVRKGFKVIAIDMAGHGGTQGLPRNAATLVAYAELLGRTLDELGIEKAVLAGHSMGGRVVAELGAMRPDRTLGVLLIDAIVGDTWDRMNTWFKFSPPLLAAVGVTLAVDSLATAPVFRDPRQAVKLLRLLRPTVSGHANAPWRLAGPVISMLRSGPSRHALEVLADHDVPTYAIHGALDIAVPLQTARDAVRRANGELITVHRAGHSWLLKDPETLPAIVAELLDLRLGDAVRNAVKAAGAGSLDELEDAFYALGAPILAMTPADSFTKIGQRHRKPRYRWSRSA
jgi:pimeloyl-ACP methyl ester carboxylesterase